MTQKKIQSEIEQFLKRKNLFFPEEILQKIECEKELAIQEKDEETANRYWCYSAIYQLQRGLVTMYQTLKNQDYLSAWHLLRQTEALLIHLEQNFSLDAEPDDSYHLQFIRNILPEYEKLFPYEYFICRETVVKKQRCTICGESVKLRGGCSHLPGKVYMGQLCIHEAVDVQYLKTKITQDPFNKQEYLVPYDTPQMNYNYGLLEGLLQAIHSPYDYWYVEIVKEKNPKFAQIGRNDKCPCGSGKKFKHCCMNQEDQMYFSHYKIKLMNEMNKKVDRPLTLL